MCFSCVKTNFNKPCKRLIEIQNREMKKDAEKERKTKKKGKKSSSWHTQQSPSVYSNDDEYKKYFDDVAFFVEKRMNFHDSFVFLKQNSSKNVFSFCFDEFWSQASFSPSTGRNWFVRIGSEISWSCAPTNDHGKRQKKLSSIFLYPTSMHELNFFQVLCHSKEEEETRWRESLITNSVLFLLFELRFKVRSNRLRKIRTNTMTD